MSKVAIQGDTNGSGVFTIAAPNSNTNRTLTLPDEAGTVLTSASSIARSQIAGGAGKVLQVVTSALETSGSLSGGSWQTVHSASITPSNASNKILIFATTMFSNPSAGGLEMGARIYNGSAAVVQGASNSSTTRAFLGNLVTSGSYNSWTPTMVCSEIAGTTSSKTYSVQCYGSENQVVYYNRTNQLGYEYTFTGVTTITLMEIEP